MDALKQKFEMRLPALILLAATLLFWGSYDRYGRDGPVLLESPALATAVRARGDCAETNGHYTLNVIPGGKTASLNFNIPDGIAYELIRVRGRIRTKNVVPGKNTWRCARMLLVQYDADNKWIPGHHGVVAESGTCEWSASEDVFEIDDRAALVDLVIQQTGLEGTAEFDRLVVEPVRLRASYAWWRGLFGAAWIMMGVVYVRRCRLHRRRLRVLILINALAILAGTLMPGQWIEHTADFAKDETSRIVEAVRQVESSDAGARPQHEPRDDEQSGMDQFNNWLGGIHGTGHFTLFASLCFLVYLSAALEQQRKGYYFKVAVDILLFAAVTESLQYLTIDRTPGILDWLRDFYGMVTAFLLFLPVKRMFDSRGAGIKKESF